MRNKILGIVLTILLFISLDRISGLFLNVGLEKYFGLNTPSKVLLIGHSHLMLATDKKKMEDELGCKVAKYCREGVNAIDRLQMAKHYLDSKYADSLKVVLYGVDQFMLTGEQLSENAYKLFYPFMDDPAMDSYIYQSTDKLDYWQHKLVATTRYSDALLNSSLRGWMNNWDNYKFGRLNVDQLRKDIAKGQQRKIHFNQDLQKAFENTLQLFVDRKIQIVLVNTPVAKLLNEAEPEPYQKIISYFQELDDTSEWIHYLDLNPTNSDRYELFFDAIHLNTDGQKVINDEIVEYLRKEVM